MFMERSKIGDDSQKCIKGELKAGLKKASGERKKPSHRGDEVKEKSLINSGNGTCGAGLCFPNIPEGCSG